MRAIILLVAVLCVSMASAEPLRVGGYMPQVELSKTAYNGNYSCYGAVFSVHAFKSDKLSVAGLHTQDKGWFGYIITSDNGDVFVGDADYDSIIDIVQPLDKKIFWTGCVRLEAL